MIKNSKLFICKEIIQYIIQTTNYTLKNIADVTESSIKQICSIYEGKQNPSHFTEIQLLKLYQIILEIKYKDKYENF